MIAMEKIADKDYEEEKEIIKEDDEFSGYEPSSVLLVNQDLIFLKDDIKNNKEIKKATYGKLRDINEKYVKDSISLWEQLGIKLHKVYGLDSPLNIYQSEFNDESCEIKLITPDKIPVFFNDMEFLNEPNGQVTEIMGIDFDTNEKFVAFHSIDVNKFSDYITACFYCHEIAHTQIDSMFGACKSRLNKEVISLLAERIFAYNIDKSLKTLRTGIDMDLLCLAENISLLSKGSNGYIDNINLSMYMQSYLESFNLANIYLEGNPNIKKEMQGYINSIFNGDRAVEDMLNHYDSNYKDVPKKLNLIRKDIK